VKRRVMRDDVERIGVQHQRQRRTNGLLDEFDRGRARTQAGADRNGRGLL